MSSSAVLSGAESSSRTSGGANEVLAPDSNTPVIYYFQGAGRGEALRLVCKIGGMRFMDNRLEGSQFATVKESLPFGQVPAMMWNGEIFSQSLALLRWLGDKCGLVPKDDVGQLRNGEIVFGVAETQERLSAAWYCSDSSKQRTLFDEFNTTWAPRWLAALERICARNTTRGFSIGSSITTADVAIFCLLHALNGGYQQPPSGVTLYNVSASSFPCLSAIYQQVLTIPAVQQHYAMYPMGRGESGIWSPEGFTKVDGTTIQMPMIGGSDLKKKSM